jgi:hypothetical protein
MFAEIYSDHVAATERIFSGRSKTVGASEIGQCARKVFWNKFGAHRDPEYADTWGARVRGSVFESSFWVPALRKRYGVKIKFAGQDHARLLAAT